MDIKEMKEEREKLRKLIITLERDIATAPEGNLRIAIKQNHPTYFRVTEKNDTKGCYLRRDESRMVVALAQKSYDMKLLKQAEENMRVLDHFLQNYSKEKLENVYDLLPKVRKELVFPHIDSTDRYAELWENEEYEGKGFIPGDAVHETKKGERVRSKSEVLIANALFEAGVPYKYECPIRLRGITVYPDFTILIKDKRKQKYWEHFGMMDSDEYRNDFYFKMNQYPKCGIIPGDNLIMTFEEHNSPLNFRTVDAIVASLMK